MALKKSDLHSSLRASCDDLRGGVETRIAIAPVLSDIDAEIVALERRRGKTCALKQPMM
jgi:hypothetical protein